VVQIRVTLQTRNSFAGVASTPFSVTRGQHFLNHAQGGDQALRQVALAYDQLSTGLDQYDAAVALRTASQAAFDAASEAYAHGVGTMLSFGGCAVRVGSGLTK